MKWGVAVRGRGLGVLAAGALIWASAGCGGGSGDVLGQGDSPSSGGTRSVVGGTQTVNGATVTSYATLSGDGTVQEVGVTIPIRVFENPPEEDGHGPNGAGPGGSFVALPFPAQVVSTTYFNHFELHWQETGHPPAFRYGVPHFDFHFYGIPISEVATIVPPDPSPPSADRIPPGYLYLGPGDTVPQEGVHTIPLAAFAPDAPPFTADFLVGFYAGKMDFLEPMITRAALLAKQNFTMDVPRPAVLGRATRYPTKFRATYNPLTASYQAVFSDFVTVSQ